MKRSLILGGVSLLALVLTAGVSFGEPQKPTKPTKPTTPTTKTTNPSNGGTGTTGMDTPSTMGTGDKTGMKDKKTGKKKPHHKSGKHKHKHHHKNHHHKHHKHHHVAFVAGGTDGGAVGADDEDDPEIEGDFGLLITDIDEAGPAAEAGLDVDDTILSVNGVRVQTVEELRTALKNVTGPITVVYISDDTEDVEEVEVTVKDGKMGITMEVVKLDDEDDK